MPLRVQCSAGHLMMVPDHRAGTVLRCANCGIDVQVPAAAGTAGKEVHKPRINTPALSRSDVKPSVGKPSGVKSSSGQAPRVAGHSTEAKSGIGLPLGGKKLAPPRPKLPPLPAVAKVAIEPEPVAETAPSEPIAPPIQWLEPEPTQVPPRSSQRPRMTLTGTMLAPEPVPAPRPRREATPPSKAPPVSPPAPQPEPPIFIAAEPVFEIQPEPKPEPELIPFHAAATVVAPAAPPVAVAPATDSPASQFSFISMLGVQPTAAQRHTAWQLAAALVGATLLSIGPSLWEISDYLRTDSTLTIAPWAFLLLVLGIVQLGCIMLLVQVPDWSSVWIVTLQSLALAAVYAAVLGLTIITDGDSPLVDVLKLNAEHTNGKAPPWCVCLAATYACLAFFAGRMSMKWRKVLKQMQVADEAALNHAW